MAIQGGNKQQQHQPNQVKTPRKSCHTHMEHTHAVTPLHGTHTHTLAYLINLSFNNGRVSGFSPDTLTNRRAG